MGDVRHAAPVEGVGVGVGCLASPVVSCFVVLARVSGYSRRLALVTRVIPLSLHSYSSQSGDLRPFEQRARAPRRDPRLRLLIAS